jgi:hypothetical protein
VNVCSEPNEVWQGEKSWTYVQVLLESLFSLTELWNMAVMGCEVRWMQNVTSKRGTMKYCMLTDIQVVNNF